MPLSSLGPVIVEIRARRKLSGRRTVCSRLRPSPELTGGAQWASLYGDGIFNALPAVGRIRTAGVLLRSWDRFLRRQ